MTTLMIVLRLWGQSAFGPSAVVLQSNVSSISDMRYVSRRRWSSSSGDGPRGTDSSKTRPLGTTCCASSTGCEGSSDVGDCSPPDEDDDESSAALSAVGKGSAKDAVENGDETSDDRDGDGELPAGDATRGASSEALPGESGPNRVGTSCSRRWLVVGMLMRSVVKRPARTVVDDGGGGARPASGGCVRTVGVLVPSDETSDAATLKTLPSLSEAWRSPC